MTESHHSHEVVHSAVSASFESARVTSRYPTQEGDSGLGCRILQSDSHGLEAVSARPRHRAHTNSTTETVLTATARDCYMCEPTPCRVSTRRDVSGNGASAAHQSSAATRSSRRGRHTPRRASRWLSGRAAGDHCQPHTAVISSGHHSRPPHSRAWSLMSTTNQRRGSATSDLKRVTLRMEESSVDALEALVDAGEYPNRSEAIRAGVRDLLADHDQADDREEGDERD